MRRKYCISLVILSVIFLSHYACKPMTPADLILVNGKIVTVDHNFTIAEAVAISEERIIAVGTNRQIKKHAGRKTRTIDLHRQTVIPGLIDSHIHPESASLSELAEEIPDVHTIDELLRWITCQVIKKDKGKWIIIPKFFSTRLAEM